MKISNIPVGAGIKSVRNDSINFLRIISKNLLTISLDNGCHVPVQYDVPSNMIEYPDSEEEM